jgi:hypothetical protein
MPPRPSATLEGRLTTFETKGPSTFAKIFQLAKACSKSKEFQAGDSLGNVYQHFPPEELAKIIDPAAHLTPEELDVWMKGTDGWKLEHLHRDLSDAQLRVIATHTSKVGWAFKSIITYDSKTIEELATFEERLTILRIIGTILRREEA